MSDEENQTEGERKDITIRVKHEGLKKSIEQDISSRQNSSETEEELRQTIEEKNAILETIAVKQFETDKAEFLSGIKDEAKRKEAETIIGDDPEKLENAKMLANFIASGVIQAGGEVEGYNEDGTEKVPPSSPEVKSSPPKSSNPRIQGTLERINQAYNILADPTKSQKEKDIANAEISGYWATFRRAMKQSGKQTYELPQTMQCPKCHSLVVTPRGTIPECKVCGWKGSPYQEW